MMFINVMNEDIFDVTFSIYSDNQIIRQWRMQAPRPFIEIKCESDTYEHFNLENTIKNIEKAIKGGNHYYGMGWRRVNG